MRINHNLMAMNTKRQMGVTNNNSSKSIEKLSSGMRINRAGDDAAGLSISEKMRGQIRGLNQASRNSQDAISMIQTAEGALGETQAILQRMRELAVQASNDTNVDIDREAIQGEISQLTSEINRIGNTTEFNTQKLLNGGVKAGDNNTMTKATFASAVTGTTAMSVDLGSAASTASSFGFADGDRIIVDDKVFNLKGSKFEDDIQAGDYVGNTDKNKVLEALKNLTDGNGTKLSDMADLSLDSNGALAITSKSAGSDSRVAFQFTAAAGAGTSIVTANSTKMAVGEATTYKQKGFEMADAIVTTGDVTIAKNKGFDLYIGDDAAANKVEVKFSTGKSYAFSSAKTDEEKKAMMDELVNDINSALQEAGLGGKVTAQLSKNQTLKDTTLDNEFRTYKLQLVSNTGQDLIVKNADASLSGAKILDNFDETKISMIDTVTGSNVEGQGFEATFQTGANQGQAMALRISDMRASALGVTATAGQNGFTDKNVVTQGTDNVSVEAALDVSTHEKAANAVTVINSALEKVSSERSNLGAVQNRLEHTIKNLDTSAENLQASESRIRDVDMAKEMMEFNKNNILQQAAQAMLAQANQAPQGVLQLLR